MTRCHEASVTDATSTQRGANAKAPITNSLGCGTECLLGRTPIRLPPAQAGVTARELARPACYYRYAMRDWITGIVESSSYAGIIFLMFLENVFPPIPSELIMPLAGFVAADGKIAFAGVAAAGTTGSVAGALALFLLGRWLGEARLSAWLNRHGKWVGLRGADLGKGRAWFERHGPKAVLLGRLAPGVRSLISIPAGIAKMNLGVFLLYTTIGSAIWSTALAAAGYWLGDNYEKVGSWLGPAGTVVLAACAIAAAVWLVRRHRRAQTQH